MAQLVTVRLSKVDSQPWGFRLQGGKDFGTPLLLQKVNSGSIADKAGLVAGDAVIKVNNVELYNLRHKDAQDAIVRSGNSFELTIQRGGSTWKPSVTPVGNISSPVSSLGSVTPVTRTSLAATPQNVQHIGCGYNSAAQPFSNAGVKSIVNKQYNTPVGMYSDETIAETLSAQAEVLAGGVLGVNFKKNEKIYNAANSEVLKALNEQDNDPEPDGSTSFSPVSVAQSNSVTKHVFAPVDKPQTPSNGLPAGQNICSDCERLIVGVFVRIKDKNLHVECFKCATCGASLKNQGYYNINNKLYCDIHARIQAALSPPPNSNGMVPVTFPPKPVSASTISAALNAHAGNLNGSGASLPTQPSNFGGARPFGYTPSAAPKSPAMAPQSPSYPPTAPWSASKPANQPAPVISQSFGENNQAKSEAHDIQDLSDNELDILLYLKKPRAPQPGFTWPPKYEEEDEPTPTACPLYVPPPETQHAKTKSTIKNINIQSQSAPADLDHLESQQNVDIECCAESHASTSTTATHSSEEYQMYHTQCTQPISSSYIDKTSHQSLNYNVQVISNQKHQTEIDRKQSLCSAEVSRINSESSNKATAKPVKNFSDPRYELLYKKYYIDEEHLSRPATPTPKNVKKVEFAEPESTCIQSNLPPVRQIFKPSTTYSTVNQYQVYQNQNESQKDCSKPCAERSCEKACSDKSFDRPCEKPCARKLSMERVNQEVQLSDEQYEQEMEDHFHLTQYTHNIHYPNALTPNTVPKGYQSPMLKALITTSNKRYCLSPEPQPVEGIDDEILYDPFRDVMRELSKAEKEAEMAKRTAIEAEKEAKRRAEEQRLREENERRAHQLFPPKVEYSLTSSLRAASPLPFENRKILSKPEPISLPEPKEPYFPPPISMEPIRYDPIDYRSKSPMLDALTTASYVPFSPFKQDVISQMDEMPKVTQHLTMSSALVYAPDTAYSSFPVEIVDINAPPKPLELTLPPIEIPQIREPPKPQKEERFLEYQMDKQLSAFAKVKPIKPQDLERRNSQDESRSMKESNKVSTQNRSFHQQSIYEEQELSLKETSQGHKKSIIENARQMERKLARTRGKNSEGSSINPNLHKPDQIPTYQRKWYRLPTQNPPRTPEPVELKSNIPLAFIETESHPVVTTTSSCTNTPTCSTQDTKPPQFKQIPIIKTESDTQYNYGNNFVTIGESTDCDSICNETRLCGASTPTKMPTMGKSPTLLPYYQQQLAWEGGFAESHTFDPASGRTPSPCANRAKSPAFGPPPNPMLPHLPRSLDPSLNPSGTYLAGQKLDKPAWNLDTNFKMKSKSLGQQQQMFNLQSSKPNYTTYSNSECQSFQQKPDVCEQKQIGNTLVQSHMQQSQFNQQAHAEMESASSQQLGNVQVQRKTKIVEEFERTQSAKTVDIIKTSVNQSVSSELPSQGIVAAQMRRLSANGCDLVSDAFARFKVDSNQLSQTSISTGTPYQYFPTQAKPEPQQNKFPTQSFESPSKEDNQISKYSFPPQSPIEPPPGFGVTNKYMTNQLSSQMLSSNSRQFSETACKLPMAENNASCNKLPPSQNPIYQPTPFAGPAKPTPPSIISKPNKVENDPNPASAGPNKSAVGATTAPKRGRGVLNKAVVGGRTPLCGSCNGQVRGPFITALGRIWCPDHFICGNNSCKHPLADIGFVEEKGNLYCEYCFEQYLAPPCSRCNNKIKGDCLNAIGRKFHPECFTCTYCGKLFGNSPFFLEEGEAYCEVDWNELFTTKCFACGFPVEAGDKWVEALNNNYHSQCFNCTMCKKNLEGQSFYAKGGRPFCKNHAR